MALLTSDYDFELPSNLIAQQPLARRDASRLLVMDRVRGLLIHETFSALVDRLHPGDLLVTNNSKVIPARMFGHNEKTGGKFELLLLRSLSVNEWWAMMKPGKRAPIGTRIRLQDLNGAATSIVAEVIGINEEGHRRLLFEGTPDLMHELDRVGCMPLPPYIDRSSPEHQLEDRNRYQTVYATIPGSVAAPTAGLHFTPDILKALDAKGVKRTEVTLHVGPGTFAPVKEDNLQNHVMHEELFEVTPEAAAQIESVQKQGGRIIAAGTTSLRVLESAATATGKIPPGPGATRLFVHPPYSFKAVQALLTNFHLPRSTLLMLVSAFAAPGVEGGRELILAAYQEAIDHGYRFFSYGDAMFIE